MVLAADAVVGQLHAGKRTVGVDGLDHQRQVFDVVVIPQAGLGLRRVVGGGVDHAFLGADHGPAALGLHLAHLRVGLRPVESHAGAVGDLIEPIFRHDRADLHRLEQDVVAWIAHHFGLPGLRLVIQRKMAGKPPRKEGKAHSHGLAAPINLGLAQLVEPDAVNQRFQTLGDER